MYFVGFVDFSAGWIISKNLEMFEMFEMLS
jgi:hypothetical protein